MIEEWVHVTVNFLNQYNVTSEVVVFILSLLPFSQSGLIAAALLRLPLIPTFIMACIGNVLLTIVLLLFTKKVLQLAKRVPKLDRLTSKIETRVRKQQTKVEGASFWGLILFVGLPFFPGAHPTAAIVATTLQLPIGRSFLAIAIGIVISNLIFITFTHVLPELIF